MAQRRKQRDRHSHQFLRPASESLKELADVTRPDPSGRKISGQPLMTSDVDAATAQRIFGGLRPEMQSTGSWSYNPSAENYALPPVPATFTPSPLVVGEDAARKFEQFAAINPEIRRSVKSITTGPDSAYIEWVLNHGRPEFLGHVRNSLPRSNRGGQISPSKRDQYGRYKDIYLDPHSDSEELREWMSHELGHALIGSNENWANRVAALLRQLPQSSGRVPGLRIEDVR
jgi:hypothetical protein